MRVAPIHALKHAIPAAKEAFVRLWPEARLANPHVIALAQYSLARADKLVAAVSGPARADHPGQHRA